MVDIFLSKNAYLQRILTVGGVLRIKGIFLYFKLSYKSNALLVSVHFYCLGAIQYQDYIYSIFMESDSRKCETLYCHVKGSSALLKEYINPQIFGIYP